MSQAEEIITRLDRIERMLERLGLGSPEEAGMLDPPITPAELARKVAVNGKVVLKDFNRRGR